MLDPDVDDEDASNHVKDLIESGKIAAAARLCSERGWVLRSELAPVPEDDEYETVCPVRNPDLDSQLPDPRLDDELLLATLEVRQSLELGAHEHNHETFGEDAGGWSFEEALETNAALHKEEKQQRGAPIVTRNAFVKPSAHYEKSLESRDYGEDAKKRRAEARRILRLGPV